MQSPSPECYWPAEKGNSGLSKDASMKNEAVADDDNSLSSNSDLDSSKNNFSSDDNVWSVTVDEADSDKGDEEVSLAVNANGKVITQSN